MDWSFTQKPLKHRTECDWCNGKLGIRRYTDSDFKRVYCSEAHFAEGRVSCIQHLKQKEKGNAKMETV